MFCPTLSDCTDCGPRCLLNDTYTGEVAEEEVDRVALGNVTTYTPDGDMIERQRLGVQEILHSKDYYTCFAAEPV